MKKMLLLLAFVAGLLSCGKTPQVNVRIVTEGSSEITSTSVVLSGSYTCSFIGIDLKVVDYGFYYGVSENNLNGQVGLNSSTKVSDSYKVSVSSLEPNTQYYYRAYVLVLAGSEHTEYLGTTASFKTADAPQPNVLPQYLGCYEMPAIALKSDAGYSNSGKESYGDTKWYNYNTTDDDQVVITHTYSDNGKLLRNWTALVDKNKKAPLWNAFVMQNDAYRRAGVGRVGSWAMDPGIPASWQQNSANSEYNRGHFVASNYRQATAEANKQTFYSTNQALQSITFNSGVWNDLELAVVGHTPSGKDTMYVVVGVLYEGAENIQNGIPCPSHFYKCLMKCSFNDKGEMKDAKGVAYLFENKPQSGSYNLGVTTIDAVEQRSGYDFFTNVPEAFQTAAESTNTPLW